MQLETQCFGESSSAYLPMIKVNCFWLLPGGHTGQLGLLARTRVLPARKTPLTPALAALIGGSAPIHDENHPRAAIGETNVGPVTCRARGRRCGRGANGSRTAGPQVLVDCAEQRAAEPNRVAAPMNNSRSPHNPTSYSTSYRRCRSSPSGSSYLVLCQTVDHSHDRHRQE